MGLTWGFTRPVVQGWIQKPNCKKTRSKRWKLSKLHIKTARTYAPEEATKYTSICCNSQPKRTTTTTTNNNNNNQQQPTMSNNVTTRRTRTRRFALKLTSPFGQLPGWRHWTHHRLIWWRALGRARGGWPGGSQGDHPMVYLKKGIKKALGWFTLLVGCLFEWKPKGESLSCRCSVYLRVQLWDGRFFIHSKAFEQSVLVRTRKNKRETSPVDFLET